MKPRIGITATPTVRDGRPVEEVNRAYFDAVTRAGGLPLVLPILDGADALALLAGLDGLLLSGGGDIDPASYGAPPSPTLDGVSTERDEWEFALVHGAFELGLPVLGICRGAQVINVAAGGTLVAHLPDVTDQVHRSPNEQGLPAHTVRIQPGSRTAKVMRLDVINVNSLHHQAVGRLGRGVRAVAWSHDRVVEAVETRDGRRAIGVQWHPELLLGHPGHRRLFTWLAREASTRAIPTRAEPAVPELTVADAV
jgi:putative glutamine amidotransferase